MADNKTPSTSASPEQLITEHLDIWTTAIEHKSSAGRGSSKKFSLYGIKKLRELILELAVRGKLVPQDPNDEPASVLLERIAAEKTQLFKDKKIKKPKVLPEMSEDEKPFEVPEGWEWTRLGEIAKKLTDGSHNPSRNNGEGYPMLSGQNVNYGKIDFVNPSRYVDQENYDKEHSRTLVQENDVLLTIVGSIGRSAVVPPMAPKFVLQRSVAVISTDLIPEFICNQFISPICMRYFDKHAKGTAQKGIYLGKLSQMLLVIPPLDEQQRIVAKVDELMSLCDALEAQTENSIKAHQTLVEVLLEALLKAPEQTATPEQATKQFQQNWQRLSEHFDTLFTTTASIDTLKQTILQLAVMGKLVPQNPDDEPAAKLLERIASEKAQLIKDKKIKKQKPLPEITDEEKPFELPHNWEWYRLGDSGLGSTGKTPSTKRSDFFDGDIPFIGPGQITPSGKIIESEKFLTEAGIQYGTEALPEDILMVCIGGSIGKSALVTERAAFNQQINCISPLYINSSFLYRALSSKSFYKSLLEKATGSATPIINRGKWEELLVPIPPVHEQHRIVAKVDELMALCDQLKARLTDVQTTKLHLTDAIVGQAL
ncbi:restriction endonuclease subunit S [Pseudoalteromonas distincta]|uniref:restriction endonuclease subunit S n=1 Tax=Pseudoalteromonas distincta TaxID=77608 RepID=UPI0011F2D2B7|nr:restriction endonuclease subunit S [Pseudoalteromonas distincta]KAA1163308.1 restriction endonuclease subunit S [Pseudoalteromonas distincta]